MKIAVEFFLQISLMQTEVQMKQKYSNFVIIDVEMM